jgi:hypothetical protein
MEYFMARQNAERLQTDLHDDVYKVLSPLVEEGKKKGISKTDTINDILKIGCERVLAGNTVITLEKIAEDISELKMNMSQDNKALEKQMSDVLVKTQEHNGSLQELVKILRN